MTIHDFNVNFAFRNGDDDLASGVRLNADFLPRLARALAEDTSYAGVVGGIGHFVAIMHAIKAYTDTLTLMPDVTQEMLENYTPPQRFQATIQHIIQTAVDDAGLTDMPPRFAETLAETLTPRKEEGNEA